MIKNVFIYSIVGLSVANADQILADPCAQAKSSCQFTGTSPSGIPFKIWVDNQDNPYIKILASKGNSEPLLLDPLPQAKFVWSCPDLLEEITPNIGFALTNSTFIDFKTNTALGTLIPQVFAVNCDKRVVAYENDTMLLGSLFISPINNLYKVINIDRYILVNQSNVIIRNQSYFDKNSNLVVTYPQASNAHDPFDFADKTPVTYKNVTVTIPVN